ncbi:MAG: 4Fe-4S binding protein, partial [Rhodospirillales bacterium]|nr:4Fe-4S binding protein [Rhodospirillales bacterium]
MAAALLAVATPALAVERFPPPDFEGGHTLPSTSTPVADPLWYDIADGAALIVAMVVATWLVLRGRSRRGVLVLGALSLLYFGFWRQGCICSIGAVQNVALAGFDGGYALPLIAAVFFLVPVLFSLLFGRTFCAGVCPLGAIQELVAIKPVRVPTAIEEPLRTLPYVYLGAAVLFAATGSAFIICEYDPFVAFFRMSGPLGMLLLGAGMLVVGMFIVRPYCRYLCPYGIVLGWFSRFSHAHARIDPQQCINCRLCEDACPVSAITRPNDASRDGDEQAQQRTRLTKVAVALPVMVLSGAALGYALSPAMSRMHPTVSLAQRIAAEDAGLYDEPTLASEAFRATGEPAPQLYANAASIAG